MSPAGRRGEHLKTSSARALEFSGTENCSCQSPAPTTRSTPCPHRPLPRLKDNLFFQRLENDGQEWLSSESDIGEPRARLSPSRRRRHRVRQSSARSKAALQAAAQGLPRGEWRSQVFCQKYQLMEAVAREKFLVPGVPTCVAGR